MATAAQITANQQNAQLSTGPRSETGRLIVSRNSLVHGLAAKKFFLADDEKPLFDELREALAEYYKPATAHERLLLEDYAQAKWRLRNAQTTETSFFDILISDQRKADSSLTTPKALARLFIDEAQQKRLRLMMRYLAAAERSAAKALKELQLVIAARREQEQRQAELQAYLAAKNPAPASSPQPSTPEAENRLCSVTPLKR